MGAECLPGRQADYRLYHPPFEFKYNILCLDGDCVSLTNLMSILPTKLSTPGRVWTVYPIFLSVFKTHQHSLVSYSTTHKPSLAKFALVMRFLF